MGSDQMKPKVLRLGKVEFAHSKWKQLEDVAEVIDCTSQNREEFFEDLKTKFTNITCIARTFASGAITGRFDEDLASQLPKGVKSISHCGAGYDQIDVESFTKRNIQVSNVTVPVEAPTADTAVYLTLASIRNFQFGHNLMVEGKDKNKKCNGVPLGHEPSSRTVGILGMGGIGRAFRDRIIPFGFKRIIYHNRSRLTPDLEGDAEYVSFETLISQSDIIMISVPLNSHTRHMINKDLISTMKDGVAIINTARGAILKEDDILEPLKSGKIGYLGSDVFEFEPFVSQDLLDLPNVVSLPHMGTHTYESIKNMEEFVIENIFELLYTGKVKTIVPEQSCIDFACSAFLNK